MNYPQLVAELEELAGALGLRVRYEKGDFEGGYCILKDEKTLVVNKRLTEVRKAVTLAQALGEVGIETTYVKPGIRSFIEDELAKLAGQNKQPPVP
jgi:hypothetical protein